MLVFFFFPSSNSSSCCCLLLFLLFFFFYLIIIFIYFILCIFLYGLCGQNTRKNPFPKLANEGLIMWSGWFIYGFFCGGVVPVVIFIISLVLVVVILLFLFSFCFLPFTFARGGGRSKTPGTLPQIRCEQAKTLQAVFFLNRNIVCIVHFTVLILTTELKGFCVLKLCIIMLKLWIHYDYVFLWREHCVYSGLTVVGVVSWNYFSVFNAMHAGINFAYSILFVQETICFNILHICVLQAKAVSTTC